MGTGMGPRNLSLSSDVTEGDLELSWQVCGDVPCQLCYIQEEGPAQGQLLSGWRFCNSASLSGVLPTGNLSPGGTSGKALGSWDTTSGSGQGCCGQLCSLCTAQTAGPRGQEGAGILY